MEPAVNPNVASWKKLECKDSGARGYHSSVLWEHFIITFGGNKDAHAPCLLNDVAILDLETGALQSIKPSKELPTARYGHSACLYDSNKIIVFGGYSDDSLNETGMLTITNKEPFSVEWEKVKTSGDEKVHRYGHTANLYGNTMYVFGGTDQTQQSSNQLWCLNLSDFSWKLCELDGPPSARTGHASVIYDKNLYIFGGFSFQKSEFLNDLWKLDLESLKWHQISPAGALPDVRRGSPAQENDGKIYIFGGLHENKVKNSLCVYDIDKNTWDLVSAEGEAPSGRSAHTMICYKDRMIIWGGFDDLYTGLPDIYCLNLASK